MPRILNHTPGKSVRGSILLAAPSRTLPELMLEQFAYLVSLNQLPKEQLSFSAAVCHFTRPKLFPSSAAKRISAWHALFWYDLAHWHPAKVAKSQNTPLLFYKERVIIK